MDMEMSGLRRAERTSVLSHATQGSKRQNRAGITLPLALLGTCAETQIQRLQLMVSSGNGALPILNKIAASHSGLLPTEPGSLARSAQPNHLARAGFCRQTKTFVY
jgi:hypothetical protein